MAWLCCAMLCHPMPCYAMLCIVLYDAINCNCCKLWLLYVIWPVTAKSCRARHCWCHESSLHPQTRTIILLPKQEERHKARALRSLYHRLMLHQSRLCMAVEEVGTAVACGMQAKSPPEIVRTGRTCAINQVLGTDMKKHFDIVSRFQVAFSLYSVYTLQHRLLTRVAWHEMPQESGSCSTIRGQRLEGKTAGHLSWLQRLFLPTCHPVLPLALLSPQPAPTRGRCPTTGNTSSPANSARYNPNLFITHSGAAGNLRAVSAAQHFNAPCMVMSGRVPWQLHVQSGSSSNNEFLVAWQNLLYMYVLMYNTNP